MANQYRCVGQVFRVLDKKECPDVTVGATYTLAMDPQREELYFVDDVGEWNYAVSGDPVASDYGGWLDEPGQIEIVQHG